MKLAPSRKGLLVRDPETMRLLPEEGEEKTLNTYWRRRLAVGDVVEVKDVPAKKKTEAAE